MESIKKKIEELGGVDLLKEKKNIRERDQLILKENPGTAIVDLIDEYGLGMFNETIEYVSIETIPVAGSDYKGGIEMIYGWGNSVHDVQWNLEQLQENDLTGYFPFAAGYPGDCICISTLEPTKGKIFYLSHDEGTCYLVANSLEDFIGSWEIAPEEDVDISGLIDFHFDDDF